jgi:hypothetical protein
MVENKRPLRPADPLDRFDDAIDDAGIHEAPQQAPRFQSHYVLQPFEPADALRDDRQPEPVPLFLSNYEDEAQLPGYTFASGSKLQTHSPRLLTGIVAIVGVGALLALFSMDSTRAVIFNSSLGGTEPAQLAVAVQPESVPPQRVAAPVAKVDFPAPPDTPSARRAPTGAMALASPSRDEIAAAYQSAVKTHVVAVEPATREAAREVAAAPPLTARDSVPPKRIEAAPARRIDADELAALLKRAKGLLAIGDITSARLLLERAADAQEAEAALMLAGTYDPQVLGSRDLRSVTPDPAIARRWYEKAAQLGSADARRRLSQIQN